MQVPQLEHPYLEQGCSEAIKQLVRLQRQAFRLQPLSPQQVQALAQSPEIAQQLQELIEEEAIDHASTNPTAPQDDRAGLSGDVLPSSASTFTAPAEIENLWASEPPDAWEEPELWSRMTAYLAPIAMVAMGVVLMVSVALTSGSEAGDRVGTFN